MNDDKKAPVSYAGAAFQVRCCLEHAPCVGLRWLSSTQAVVAEHLWKMKEPEWKLNAVKVGAHPPIPQSPTSFLPHSLSMVIWCSDAGPHQCPRREVRDPEGKLCATVQADQNT